MSSISTSSVSSELEVLEKYNSLVTQSLGSDSAYIRAKETINDLVSQGAIDDAKKAEVIASLLGNIVTGVTNAAMSTAISWANSEKEIALKKLELDQQLLILDQERLLKEAQTSQIDTQERLAKVESQRMYGTSVFDVDTGALLSLADEGKVYRDMEMVSANILNAGEERILIQSKVKESKAAIHKVVADTYINYGNFSYNYDNSDAGIANIVRTDAGHVSLSDTQQEIAVEQGKGYTYNAWANGLTGSASILGTALASGDFDFSSGSAGETLLYTVINCAENLKNTSSEIDTAEPTSDIRPGV